MSNPFVHTCGFLFVGKRKSTGVTAFNQLLESYVGVCNDVINANKNRFPYGEIWQAAEENLLGHCFQFEVTGKDILTSCPCIFHTGRIFPIEANRACMTVRFTGDYVKSVVEDPESYIQNPALINWSWMQHAPEKECNCSLMKVVARELV